jgi:hypothetical protein
MDDNTAIMIVHKWLRNFKGYKPSLALKTRTEKRREKRRGDKQKKWRDNHENVTSSSEWLSDGKRENIHIISMITKKLDYVICKHYSLCCWKQEEGQGTKGFSGWIHVEHPVLLTNMDQCQSNSLEVTHYTPRTFNHHDLTCESNLHTGIPPVVRYNGPDRPRFKLCPTIRWNRCFVYDGFLKKGELTIIYNLLGFQFLQRQQFVVGKNSKSTWIRYYDGLDVKKF